MDDLIIASNSWNSHLQQLELTLQTLQDANIACSPRKTEIGFPEIDYLGFRVSRSSLRLSEKRIEIISKITAPKNVKALQRILGMINYWRRYIPFLSRNAVNMRKLLQKDTAFKWTSACEAELNYIKKTLVSDPILKPIDPTRDIVISTDGSKSGLEWAHMQPDDDGNLHAISYGACSTTSAQSHYSADDLEACALVYALKAIEEVAIHKRVTVITDNSHLLHLNTWQPINARQRRMLAYLMHFNLSIRYIRGSRNMLADALSRVFQDTSDQERKDYEPKYMHEIDHFILPITTRSVTRAALEETDETTDDKDMPMTPQALSSGGQQPQTTTYDPLLLLRLSTDN